MRTAGEGPSAGSHPPLQRRPSMRGPTISAIVAGALLLVLAVAAPASASSRTAPIESAHLTPASPAGVLNVALRVARFVHQGTHTRAVGTVTATLSGAGGAPTTVRQRVLLQVGAGRTCSILTLTLDQLNLVLLGVTVHLDRVELRVTGQRRGGVLGRLFCSLAGARLASSRAAAGDGGGAGRGEPEPRAARSSAAPDALRGPRRPRRTGGRDVLDPRPRP